MMGTRIMIERSTFGVAGTTRVAVEQLGIGSWRAAVGIGILGSTNMSLEELRDADPLSEDFRDNIALGEGSTQEEALENMKQNMREIADSLWM